MCLIANKKSERAKEDIVCYKVLGVDCDGRRLTPFEHRLVPNGVLSGRRLFRARGRFINRVDAFYVKDSFCKYYDVYGGYIHVYTSKIPIETWNELYECVIPKGTRFWTSYNGKEYAARKIRFIRKVA